MRLVFRELFSQNGYSCHIETMMKLVFIVTAQAKPNPQLSHIKLGLELGNATESTTTLERNFKKLPISQPFLYRLS